MTDGIRAKELYKYYRPNTTSAASTIDPTLTAFTQLVAWRLQAQRALVSLIDREVQYFIAEATKTVHLENPLTFDEPGDAIWAGCSAVPKVGRLCERTLEEPPPSNGAPALFEICNLAEDSRFNHLPFISGAPHFRYYVGTPIITRNGIPIGSVFALDDSVREPISDSNRDFLGGVACNVMRHLEMLKEQEEKKRAMRMNSSLAAFVNPELQKRRSPREQAKGATDTTAGKSRHSATIPVTGEATEKPEPAHTTDGEDDANDGLSGQEGPGRFEVDEHLRTFQRACRLIYEALSLHEGSGGEVLILDTSASFQRDSSDPGGSDDGSRPEGDRYERRSSQEPLSPMTSTAARGSAEGYEGILSPRLGHFCDVLAMTAPKGDDGDVSVNSAKAGSEFMLISDLIQLSKRHMSGRLFDLDPETTMSSSSGEEILTSLRSPVFRRRHSARDDTLLLQSYFPGARQVIFVPLWNTDMARWVGCFITNKSDYRTFSTQDFLFGLAFCNCVMMHIQKIATATSDQQKSDFIGSISHELRSPLHGILASCEFLQDTECDSFQHSLVETASSCAHTLLDTINLVLDYSKLNAFERNARKARKRRRDQGSSSTSLSMMDPALNIYGYVDLALIAEEVIEGLVTGHLFQNGTKGDGSDFAISNDSVSRKAVGRASLSDSLTAPASGPAKKSDVEILVDISHRQSWSFVTQPGAFRRIIMNLLGNSLKYTSKGFIRVRLEATDLSNPSGAEGGGRGGPNTIVTLTVTDTGKGMAPDYLRTKLFTPFAQESALNPGTGLGLSLVKSIVTMLGGEVGVKSAVGVGTEFVITLPMSNLAHSSSSSAPNTATPSSSGSLPEKDNLIGAVKGLASNEHATLFSAQRSQETQGQREAADYIRSGLKKYLDEWLGFASVSDWQPGAQCSVVVVDELDLDGFLTAAETAETRQKAIILVLCTNSSRRLLSKRNLDSASVFEFLSLPVGPHKLARALRSGLERTSVGNVKAAVPSPIPETESPEKEVTVAVKSMTLTSPETGVSRIAVMQQGETLGRKESANAHRAMDTGSTKEQQPEIEKHSSFPFPEAADSEEPVPQVQADPPEKETEPAPKTQTGGKSTKRPTANLIRTASSELTNMIFRQPTSAPTKETETPFPETKSRSPRLLLVDDNKINLRLLQTFMKKRAYTAVHSAEDGAQAVTAFRDLVARDPPEPPDIVFMDLSMPVCDGFEATQQIRQLEAEIARELPPHQTPAPALIIALTGLASGRDQSKAFVSGFDLYMTKPTSFREVARLLDNWESNGGAGPEVPHGPVTGENTPTAGAM